MCTTPSSCSLTCNDGPQLEGAKTSFKDIPSRCELASSSDDVVPEEVCVDGGLLDTRGGLVLLASETGQDHLGAKPVANCYLEELRALEQKLGLEADLGDQVTQVTRRQRLRQELENDGFDSGLQDILDDILVSITLDSIISIYSKLCSIDWDILHLRMEVPPGFRSI